MNESHVIEKLEAALLDYREGRETAQEALGEALEVVDAYLGIPERVFGDTVLGDHISTGDISGSTAVAIGSDIRIAIRQHTLPDEVVGRLVDLANLLEQRASHTLVGAGHLRIFISSPGDVGDERGLAMEAIRQIQNDPIYKERVSLEIIAWDRPNDSTPMLASMTPQEAINQGLATPAECDIVVVILWSRFGTPLSLDDYQKADGSQYQSGTEWEYENAMEAARKTGQPLLVVYRRTQEPIIGLKDPDRDEKIAQYDRVEQFFSQFVAPDGSIRQGYNTYATPSEFADIFGFHLRKLIARLIQEDNARSSPGVPDEELAIDWPTDKSPFPGLRAFGPDDAPVFFGRGLETDEILKQIAGRRFTAVVGASGSGKSSLVNAGVRPRLVENAIEGSKDWFVIRFTPDDLGIGDPFASLAAALRDDPLDYEAPDLAPRLRHDPDLLAAICREVLTRDWGQVLLFVDQFEEMFTRISDGDRQRFAELLEQAVASDVMRVVVTLRSDFYTRCLEHPVLATLVKEATYSLAPPKRDALREMIERPAAVAGLTFEPGLARRILDDTREDPGALALMAFALHELYLKRDEQGRLTIKAYESFNGVQGAIGQRAQQAYEALDGATQATLPQVFRELVAVDIRGEPTRRRAELAQLAADPHNRALVEQFTRERLLVQSRGEDGQPVVEVAHEALFRSWPRLHDWITQVGDDLRIGSELARSTQDWSGSGRDPSYLLRGARLEIARYWLDRADRMGLVGDAQRTFVDASLAEKTRQEEEERERQQRELELAKQVAEEESKRREVLRSIVIIGLIVLILGSVMLNNLNSILSQLPFLNVSDVTLGSLSRRLVNFLGWIGVPLVIVGAAIDDIHQEKGQWRIGDLLKEKQGAIGLAVAALVVGIRINTFDDLPGETGRVIAATGGLLWYYLVMVVILVMLLERRRRLAVEWRVLVLGFGGGMALSTALTYPVVQTVYTRYVPGIQAPTRPLLYAVSSAAAILILLGIGPLSVRWLGLHRRSDRALAGLIIGGLSGLMTAGAVGGTAAGVVAQSPLYGFTISREGFATEAEWTLRLAQGVNSVIPLTTAVFFGLLVASMAIPTVLAWLTPVPHGENRLHFPTWAVSMMIGTPLLHLNIVISSIILALLGPSIADVFADADATPALDPNLGTMLIPIIQYLFFAGWQIFSLVWLWRGKAAGSRPQVVAFAYLVGFLGVVLSVVLIFAWPNMIWLSLIHLLIYLGIIAAGIRLHRRPLPAEDMAPQQVTGWAQAGLGAGLLVGGMAAPLVLASLNLVLIAVALIPDLVEVDAPPPGLDFLLNNLRLVWELNLTYFLMSLALISLPLMVFVVLVGRWRRRGTQRS